MATAWFFCPDFILSFLSGTILNNKLGSKHSREVGLVLVICASTHSQVMIPLTYSRTPLLFLSCSIYCCIGVAIGIHKTN